MNNLTRINFWLSNSLLERLQAAKVATGISVVEIVRRALDSYLKEIGL